MNEWVTKRLKESEGVDVEVRRKWWITLIWYYGFCASRELGDPGNRENGKIFWRDAVKVKDPPPEKWQEEQWGAALKWFYDELASRDQAGREMRSAIRRRHLAYPSERAYMAWLRRFQAFVDPLDAMMAQEYHVVRFLTYLAEERRIAQSGQN